MALIGIQLDRHNPEFTASDFIFWMPQYKNYIDFYSGKILVGQSMKDVSIYKNNLYVLTIDNKKVDLITADEIVYTGTYSIVISSTETITYTVNLNSSTMLLTLTNGVTTQTTLKSAGLETYNYLYDIANHKIFKSIYGTDWQMAMGLCIAHYLTLMANQDQAPAGNTLRGIAGGSTRGVMSSMSVGEFSKTYDLTKTMVEENEAMFWNLTSYGAELMALLKTKAVPSILVVTSHNIPGAN